MSIIHMLKLYKSYIDAAKNCDNFIKYTNDELVKIENKRVLIRHDVHQVRRYVNMICNVSKLSSGVYYIATDDEYKKLPPQVKKFFILHEVGHILNGDLDKESNMNILSFPKRDMNQEYLADEYAASIIGIKKAIKCLTFINTVEGISKRDISKRIGNLKDLCDDVK